MSRNVSHSRPSKNRTQLTDDLDVDEGSTSRRFFVLRLRLCKRENVPELSRQIIYDHLIKMNELDEMIVAQEEIKLLPHQQAHAFKVFIITKKKLPEEAVLNYMLPLLSGERTTSFDDPYRSVNCTPEMKISGLIHKSFRSTVTALTKIDHHCFYGGRPASEQSIFDTDDFHKK